MLLLALSTAEATAQHVLAERRMYDARLDGLEIALQVFYGPTRGVLGYDLSNGIHAKLGD